MTVEDDVIAVTGVTAITTAAVGAVYLMAPGFTAAKVVCGPAGSLGLPGGICYPVVTKNVVASAAPSLKSLLASKAVATGSIAVGKTAAIVAAKATIVSVAAPAAVIVVSVLAVGILAYGIKKQFFK